MKKKIWILNHYASDMYINKGGRHYWFAENLIKKGYEPTIFCANTFHNKADYIDTGEKKYTIKKTNGIPFVFIKTTVAIGNGLDRLKNMLIFYKNIYSVAKDYVKNNEMPDVILASSVHPLTMVAGIKIAKKMGIPCICEVRDLWPEAIFFINKVKEKSILGRLLTAGEHWIYKNADSIIFTKEGDIDYIIEKKWDEPNGGSINLSDIFYINNGVDIDNFIQLRKDEVLDDNDLNSQTFNVIYVGSIRPVNDVDKIIDAAKLLKNDKVQFLIYGEGNEKSKIEARIINENINNVKLKGHVNKKYIPYILSKSSVNLLNYSQEKYNWSRGNSSNKLFEYMASGKPIISTIKMGYSIIEKYKCGIELENNSSEELARAVREIKEMEKNKYNTIGANAFAGAKNFDIKHLTNKLISVIEKNH